MRTTATIIAIACCSPGGIANAQQGPTQAQCDSLTTRFATGTPSGSDFSTISLCPQRGMNLAAYLVRLFPETDSLKIRVPFYLALAPVDGDVFGALMQNAANLAATPLVRNFSIRGLIAYESPGAAPGYASLIATPVNGRCDLGITDNTPIQPSPGTTPVPSNHTALTAQLAATIAGSSAPATVKGAARCLQWVTTPIDTSVPPPGPISPQAIKLNYVCGKKFVVNNLNYADVPVTYSVNVTAETGSLVVPARRAGTNQREMVFFTRDSGTVRLFYAGQQIQQKTSTGAACP